MKGNVSATLVPCIGNKTLCGQPYSSVPLCFLCGKLWIVMAWSLLYEASVTQCLIGRCLRHLPLRWHDFRQLSHQKVRHTSFSFPIQGLNLSYVSNMFCQNSAIPRQHGLPLVGYCFHCLNIFNRNLSGYVWEMTCYNLMVVSFGLFVNNP